MTWHAKLKGAYTPGSVEWNDNVQEIWNQLSGTWTAEAVAGMVGNMQSESGLNPWRWQSDRDDISDRLKGYGLPQFTPASGYINDYGRGVEGYAPSLSTSYQSAGASPSDGHAQIIVIDEDRAGKYLNRTRYCDYWDISAAYPFSAYKRLTDLYTASTGWLFDYEFPADRSKAVADARYQNAVVVYEFLKGHPPEPPGPGPGPGPGPSPVYGDTFPRGMGWKRLRFGRRRI